MNSDGQALRSAPCLKVVPACPKVVQTFSAERTNLSIELIVTMTKDPFIVIVDDDDALRASLDNLIRSVGYRTKGFSSAATFLESRNLYDTACLIVDVRMAHMDGLDLQREIVAAKWPIPIIFMTSYADEAVRAKALAAGAVDFLYKPFPEEKLLKAIDKVLHRS